MDAEDVAGLKAQLAALTALVAERLGPAPAPRADASPSVKWIYEQYEPARKHDHSWRMMEDKLAPLIRLCGEEPALELTPARWERHRTVRRTEVMAYGRSKGRPPAETTLNIELGCAKVMLEWAVEHGYLAFNPLRKTRRKKTKSKRKTWLPEDWLDRLLSFKRPKGDEQRACLRAWVLAIFDSGARFNEARMLRRDRLRRRADEADEPNASSGWVIGIDETKNSKAHVLGLTHRTFDALMAIDEVTGSPYFFARRATKRLWAKRTMHWWFHTACENTGIDAVVAEGEVQVRPHDGRRSAATNASRRGADLLAIQRMLNHSNPNVTADYVQIDEDNAIKVAKLMERGVAKDQERKPPKRTHLVPVPSVGKVG